MKRIDFWQVSRDPVEKIAPLIAARVLDGGDRLLIVAADADLREKIGRALWETQPDSFLANGAGDAPYAARQPILVSDNCTAANGANHILFADGEWRVAEGFSRIFLLFDEVKVEKARKVWRELDGLDETERAFFRQEEGKWIKAA